MTATSQLVGTAGKRLLARNPVFEAFFASEAGRLARACQQMAARFQQGGRLLAFGRGVYSTDAQHVSVEFVHPIVVGKRALPALDISMGFLPWLDAMVRPEDIAMGFGPPGGDSEVERALTLVRDRGAMTFALPGRTGDYAVEQFSADPFLHQEMIELLYHTLWETVHVFFEHGGTASDAGQASFLYPFLGSGQQQTETVLEEVAASILMKVADDACLRARVASEEADAITNAALALANSVLNGGKLILFGNGGSATDANDWALDCIAPPTGLRPVPAVSLANDSAVITAIANDVGNEAVFLRQLIAQARSGDAAVAISTSGGSANIILALEEAKRRGLVTVALLGYDGGETLRRGLAAFPIVVRCDYIPRIQEVQASIYHVIRELM